MVYLNIDKYGNIIFFKSKLSEYWNYFASLREMDRLKALLRIYVG